MSESYKHKFAKQVLVSWLREEAEIAGHDNEASLGSCIGWRVNRREPYWGVWEEYPICKDVGLDNVWDEGWGGKFKFVIPTYEELIALNMPPLAILDIAIQEKGRIAYGIEVIHKNYISRKKGIRIFTLESLKVYQIDADWILNQVKKPSHLALSLVIG
jgi:hypothetical protein